MSPLNNVPLGWLEYDNHKGKIVQISDRSNGVYRCKTGDFDPFSKTLRMVFPGIKEMGIITSGYLYSYGSVIFPGMYKTEIGSDRFSKLIPVGSGYSLTKADMNELMLAYYKVGSEQWDGKSMQSGVPVPIVREITGANQIVIRDDLNVESSPDLAGKTIHVRVEFPMPEPTRQIPQGYLNAIIMHDDKLKRLRWCHYTASTEQETAIVLSHWEEEEKLT